MGITAFNASALLNGQQSGIMGTTFAGNSAKNTLKSTEEKQKTAAGNSKPSCVLGRTKRRIKGYQVRNA